MKKSNLTVSYDGEKLTTIQLYMGQKGLSMDDEISKAIDVLYTKHVPQNVRDYLDLKNSQQKTAAKSKNAKPALPDNISRGDGS